MTSSPGKHTILCPCQQRDHKEALMSEEIEHLKRYLSQQSDQYKAQIKAIAAKSIEHQERARERSKQLEEQIERMHRAELKLSTELAQAQSEKVEVERVFNVEMAAMDARIVQISEMAGNQQQQLRALEKTKHELQNELQAARDRIHVIMDEGTQELGTWKSKVDTLATDLQSTKEKLSACRSENARLESMISELASRVDDAHFERDNAKSRAADLAEIINGLHIAADKYAQEQAILQAQIHQLTERNSSIPTFEAEIQYLRNQNSQIKSELEIRDGPLAEDKKEIQLCNRKIEGLTLRLSEHQVREKHFEKVENELSKMKLHYREIVEKGHQLELLVKKSNDDASTSKAKLESNVMLIRQSVETLSDIISRCSHEGLLENAELNSFASEDIGSACHGVVLTVQHLQLVNQSLKSEVDRLTATLADNGQKIQQLRSQHDHQSQMLSRYTQSNEEKERRLKEAEERSDAQFEVGLRAERAVHVHIAKMAKLFEMPTSSFNVGHTLDDIYHFAQLTLEQRNQKLQSEISGRLKAESLHSSLQDEIVECRQEHDDRLVSIRHQLQQAMETAEQRLQTATDTASRANDACRLLYRAYLPLRRRQQELHFQKNYLQTRTSLLEGLHVRVRELAGAMASRIGEESTFIKQGLAPKQRLKRGLLVALAVVRFGFLVRSSFTTYFRGDEFVEILKDNNARQCSDSGDFTRLRSILEHYNDLSQNSHSRRAL